MIADEFGGDVPVGPFALIGDDWIGQAIVETLRGSRSPAVLMQNHAAPDHQARTPRKARPTVKKMFAIAAVGCLTLGDVWNKKRSAVRTTAAKPVTLEDVDPDADTQRVKEPAGGSG